MFRQIIIIALLTFGFCFSAGAQTKLLPPNLEALRNKGVDALFNMNYAAAESQFREMIRLSPEHPAGHIYLANTVWLGHLAALRRLQTGIYNRGNTFFNKKEDVADPKIEKEFLEHIKKGMQLAEQRINRDKTDVAAVYYLGVAKNINAGFEATVRRSFFAALRNGSKGVDLHREVMRMNPSLIDAQLSVGMYNYVVGALPLAVKILVFFGGVRGSKKDGLRMLERVAAEGNYAKDEASVILVMLYNREKRLDSCLKILKYLTHRYPSNSLFRLEMATTLGQLMKYGESFAIFDSLLRNDKAYNYMPDLIHYQYAETLADAERWPQAYEHYLQAAASAKAPPSMIALAHLQAGKAMDAAGDRNKAIEQYQQVLNLSDVFDSHERAKKYLEKPYVP